MSCGWDAVLYVGLYPLLTVSILICSFNAYYLFKCCADCLLFSWQYWVIEHADKGHYFYQMRPKLLPLLRQWCEPDQRLAFEVFSYEAYRYLLDLLRLEDVCLFLPLFTLKFGKQLPYLLVSSFVCLFVGSGLASPLRGVLRGLIGFLGTLRRS